MDISFQAAKYHGRQGHTALGRILHQLVQALAIKPGLDRCDWPTVPTKYIWAWSPVLNYGPTFKATNEPG